MQARCGLTTAPLFSPAVIPAHRGMVVEVPLPLAAMPGTGTPEAMRAALADHYAGSAVVAMGEPPADGEMLLRGSDARSEEHTSELQSLMRLSYAVFCLKKKK